MKFQQHLSLVNHQRNHFGSRKFNKFIHNFNYVTYYTDLTTKKNIFAHIWYCSVYIFAHMWYCSVVVYLPDLKHMCTSTHVYQYTCVLTHICIESEHICSSLVNKSPTLQCHKYDQINFLWCLLQITFSESSTIHQSLFPQFFVISVNPLALIHCNISWNNY